MFHLVKNLVSTDKFDVIGLEARDRVGGRVFTDSNGNELGAAWIHGTELINSNGRIEINPVYELATEFIPTEELYDTMNFHAVHSDGSDLDSDRCIWENMWKVLNKIKTSKESISNAYKVSNVSVYDFISLNWSELIENSQGSSEMAVVKSVIEWQSYYATLWERTSIGSLAVDKEFEGDQLLIKNGGYTRILNRYLDHYNLRKYIQLNTVVDLVETLPSGTSLVHSTAGGVFEADIVVVTVPLGVLKNKSIKFNPPLPEWKQNSIDRLGFGVYDKIFVTFASPIEEEEDENGFWPPNVDVISIVPRSNDDYNDYHYSCKLHLEKSKDSIRPERRAYNDRESEHIGIEMANISAVTGVPKVVMLIYDQAALEMEKIAHDKKLLTEFVLIKLRNAFPRHTIPEIVKVEATTWGSDPFAYGSFANIPLGASGQDMINLSIPLNDGKVLFAGEATFPLHYSTVHGALKSGRREFARIMKSVYPDELNEFENLLIDYAIKE